LEITIPRNELSHVGDYKVSYFAAGRNLIYEHVLAYLAYSELALSCLAPDEFF
jgi:hypothetical protein